MCDNPQGSVENKTCNPFTNYISENCRQILSESKIKYIKEQEAVFDFVHLITVHMFAEQLSLALLENEI